MSSVTHYVMYGLVLIKSYEYMGPKFDGSTVHKSLIILNTNEIEIVLMLKTSGIATALFPLVLNVRYCSTKYMPSTLLSSAF